MDLFFLLDFMNYAIIIRSSLQVTSKDICWWHLYNNKNTLENGTFILFSLMMTWMIIISTLIHICQLQSLYVKNILEWLQKVLLSRESTLAFSEFFGIQGSTWWSKERITLLFWPRYLRYVISQSLTASCGRSSHFSATTKSVLKMERFLIS